MRLTAAILAIALLTVTIQGYAPCCQWQSYPWYGPPFIMPLAPGPAVPVDINPTGHGNLTPEEVIAATEWAINEWNHAGTTFRLVVRDRHVTRTTNEAMCGCVLVRGDRKMSALLHGVVNRLYLPGKPFNGIANAVLSMNGTHLWTVSLTDHPPYAVDYPAVMLHEMGHVVGLEHSTVAGAVMWTPSRVLKQDDLDGIRFLYPAQAVPLPPADLRE